MRPPRRTGRRSVVGVWLVLATALAACTGPVPGSPAGPVASASPSASTPSPTPVATPTPTPTPTSTTTAPTTSPSAAPAELPRGGRTVFPHHRLVGYAGLTGSRSLGRLGIGDVDERLDELERRAKPYATKGRTVLPTMEVITSIVSSSAGSDGKWRIRLSDRQIQGYLDAARRHDALLLLAIQPGRSTFLDELRAYEKFLRQPDVGVALDPEWAMSRGQVPGRVFGHTTGAELDEVSRYLAGVVARHDLPEKVMVYHQLAVRIVRQENELRQHDGVVAIKSVDGIGTAGAKINTYDVVNRTTPSFVRPGFKLFYEEDSKAGRLMTPQQVLALDPRPDYVMYE